MLNRACNSYIVDRLHPKNTPQDFINWLQSKNFTLPKELLQAINKQNLNDLMMQHTEQAEEEKPAELVKSISDTPETDSAQDVVTLSIPVVQVTLPHMTERLEKLFKIMREHWQDFDKNRLPKQTNIANQINKELGYTFGAREGNCLAALIKPDELSQADDRANKRR
jgi:NAD-specific glutamate dehydrogenase